MTLSDARPATLADAETGIALQMDEDAFRGFYDRTSRLLWAYLHRVTGDPHAADDLLQESYYRFLRADAALDSEAHRRHYLFRIATNLTRDRFRTGAMRPVHVAHDEEDPRSTSPRRTNPEARLDLSAAMAQLRARERAMLWLAYGQGASHKEIAAVLGVTAGSVKPLLFRARRKLAALLGRRKEPS